MKTQTLHYDFADLGDLEELTHISIGEAVGAYLDGLEREDWPETLEVGLYRRRPITEEHISKYTGCALCAIVSRLNEDTELHNPEHFENVNNPYKCLESLRNAVRTVLEDWPVRACDQVGTETVNVVEWVKENEPHWLEEE